MKMVITCLLCQSKSVLWVIFVHTFLPSYSTYFVSFFPPFIFISWRLITLQYYSGFCHTLT